MNINYRILLLFVAFNSQIFGFSYTNQARKITHKYCKEVSQHKGIHMDGYGGAFMDDIQEIDLSYVSHDILNVEEARRLFIETAESYLCYINSDEKIRPYLHDYPFTMKNLKLMIAFEDQHHKHMSNGHVCLMFYQKNKIIYCTYDYEKDDFVDLHKEPYEEAKQLVLCGTTNKCVSGTK